MEDSILFQTEVFTKTERERHPRELRLYQNMLIIQKEHKHQTIPRKFQLNSFDCSFKWIYMDTVLKQLEIYDSRRHKKVTYEQSPEILAQIKIQLDGKCFYRDFQSFYRKVKIIKSHKNIDIILCQNFVTGELVVAKSVKFENHKAENYVLEEAKIYFDLSYIPHKYLLHAKQIFLNEQTVIYIMDYCKGGTLYDYLIKMDLQIPEIETKKILYKILKGLNHLHKNGIAHRDIKLDNIMFMKENDTKSLKIIDFGYAAHINNPQFVQQRCGTQGYIAPEIINQHNYNQLCDIYSLGCVFHALLTGKKVNYQSKSTKGTASSNMNSTNVITFSKIEDLNATELIEMMLSNKKIRPSAIECLNHKYLEGLKSNSIEDLSSKMKKLSFPSIKNPFQE